MKEKLVLPKKNRIKKLAIVKYSLIKENKRISISKESSHELR